jgi:hypothetical protein
MSDADDKEQVQTTEPEKEQITLGTEWQNPITVKNSKDEQKQYNSNNRN